MDVVRFKRKPVMGIVRGLEKKSLKPLIDTVIDAGLETLEITMNTKSAAGLIAGAVGYARGRLTIGAGTVLGMNDLKRALASGATFIVMPVLVKDVIRFCGKKNIPVFPGALTVQEIYTAWNAGATMVKVFPAQCFGPEYFRSIKGPLGSISLMACAGVTPANMKEYFSCGASAVAIGGGVFKETWLAKRDFARIRRALDAYLRQLTIRSLVM
ncbi:MAG: bifunctional 4-hydroxy-2-oxoglutarate aldolase/2-dehydro-3-deoxy-phosphogluconate aldolase [Candidatus Omnitrophota bacterium]|nr:bifunctional 4-hydroxy-2-oxoglutarate aldolase/2-dehydro-3-deoxy-phosphogluconate aldolase [Candidatus Omnitrophota bacterium]